MENTNEMTAGLKLEMIIEVIRLMKSNRFYIIPDILWSKIVFLGLRMDLHV